MRTIMLCSFIASAVAVSGLGASAAPAPNACAMLSSSQLRTWFGKEMVPQATAGIPQAQGCQWAPKDGSQGALTLTIAPARYYVAPSLGKGFMRLNGIGEKAYIVPSLGGWEAGAVKGSKVVGIRTPAMSQHVAITVLKTLVAKL